jgi:hypothetical protein
MAVQTWIFEKAKNKLAVFEAEKERKLTCIKANICWRCGRDTKDSSYTKGRMIKTEFKTVVCPSCGVIKEEKYNKPGWYFCK